MLRQHGRYHAATWRALNSSGGAAGCGQLTVYADDDKDTHRDVKVRMRRQVGPEARPTSAFYSYVPTGMHGPTCVSWANLTPLSLKTARAFVAGMLPQCAGITVHGEGEISPQRCSQSLSHALRWHIFDRESLWKYRVVHE